MKLTPIFPPHIKPVRKGVYKTWFTGYTGIKHEGYSYWNNKKWSHQRPLIKNEDYYIGNGVWSPANQNKSWQGVLK